MNPSHLLVFGQSLGGAIAITAVASTNAPAVCGVAVESTFDSYTAIAKDKAPDFLTQLLISDALSPIDVVSSLPPAPLLVIHGTADRVVPYARGKRLYDKARSPKQLWTVKQGRHTQAFTMYGATYRPKLVAFFKQCLDKRETAHTPVPSQP